MKKDFRLSISSIKKYNASPATWAWYYILWIKESFQSDALPLGNLFEDWLLTGKDNYDLHLADKDIYDMEALIEDYDNLKYNAWWLNIEKWASQYKVEWELFWKPFLWFIDNITDERIDDIKTSRYLSKKDAKQKNHWSWLTYYEEYELQLWAYMKVMRRQKARIIEVAKHRYKDWEPRNQIIEFHMTPERDKSMTDKWSWKVDEMSKLRDKYNPVLQNI